MARSRRRLWWTLVALLALLGCSADSASVSLSFDLVEHPNLIVVDLGSWVERRVEFEDHDIYPWVRFQEGFVRNLGAFDPARAERVEAGEETLPMETRLRFSPRGVAAEDTLFAVNVTSVTAVQDGEASFCTRADGSDAWPVRAEFGDDPGGAVPAYSDSPSWSEHRTDELAFSCEVAYARFELHVAYDLVRAHGQEATTHTATLTYEPSGFRYRAYNRTAGSCLRA